MKGGEKLAIYNDRIKKLRVTNNLTLKTVAEYVDVTEATMQRYESGNGIKTVTYEIIEKLAGYYKCSPAYLMGWEDKEEKAKAINSIIADKNAMRMLEYYMKLAD